MNAPEMTEEELTLMAGMQAAEAETQAWMAEHHSAPNTGTPGEWAERHPELIATGDICELHGGKTPAKQKKAHRGKPDPIAPAASTPVPEEPAPLHGAYVDVPLDWLWPSPSNARRVFDDDELASLAASIKEHGLQQAIVVRERPWPDDGSVRVTDAQGATVPYLEIVAGERRFRACKLIGLRTVPVHWHADVDDLRAQQLSLIENVQRVDLDPLEAAHGYAALVKAGMTQSAIAAAVGKSQPAIAKSLGLLKLPEDVQAMVQDGRLTSAHAAALERFSEFPRYLSAVAEMVIGQRWTSKQLAEDTLPMSYAFTDTNGPARHIYPHSVDKFDMSQCKQCPFNALRPGRYNEEFYCINAEHYDQLFAEAEASRRAETKAKVQATRADAPDLPFAKDLHGCKDLSFTKLPAGCTTDCACRTKAIDGAGRVVEICTDPKCFAKLESAATRASNKAKRDDAKERLEAVGAHIDSLIPLQLMDSNVLAAVLIQAVGYQIKEDIWTAVGQRLGKPELAAAFHKRDYTALSKFLGTDLVRMLLEVLITAELKDKAEGGYHGTKTYECYRIFAGAALDPKPLPKKPGEAPAGYRWLWAPNQTNAHLYPEGHRRAVCGTTTDLTPYEVSAANATPAGQAENKCAKCLRLATAGLPDPSTTPEPCMACGRLTNRTYLGRPMCVICEGKRIEREKATA